MARRIALTMLSLVGALLLGAVVPLGLITTARERASFRQDTVLTARAFAAIAEDGVTEPGPSPAIASFLARASKSDEAGWVYNAAGRLIAHSTAAASPGGPGLPAGPAAPVPAIMRAVQRGGGISITGAAWPAAGGCGRGHRRRPAAGRSGGARPVHRRTGRAAPGAVGGTRRDRRRRPGHRGDRGCLGRALGGTAAVGS